MLRSFRPAAAAGAVLALALGGAGIASGQGHDGHHGGSDDRSRGASERSAGGGGRTLFAALNGRNELHPRTLRRGAGDLNGYGASAVTIDGTTLCWSITVANISQPVAAHIHRAVRSRNGAVVVPLAQPSSGNPGASSGCVQVAGTLARAIRRRPSHYYVNVHTPDFPEGAVRGQLFRKHR